VSDCAPAANMRCHQEATRAGGPRWVARRRRFYIPGAESKSSAATSVQEAKLRAALPFDAIIEARRRWEVRGWPEPEAMAAAHSIMRASQIILADLDAAVEPFGITYARFEVLAYLSFSRNNRLPLNKLSARLRVHPASMTNTLNRLEAAGLAQRVPDPTNKRVVFAEITDAGRNLMPKATAAIGKTKFGVGALDLEQMRTLVDIITAVRRDHLEFIPPASETQPNTL
jgi:DNA-binding MarR family transcriptional regulator